MKVKFKKLHPDAIIPIRAKEGDAGLDLTAISGIVTEDYIEYDTGLAFEIPTGYVGLIFPRSSISKTGHSLANSVGVLDSSYRGSVKVRMRYKKDSNNFYIVGDKIAQLVIIKYWDGSLEETDNLSETNRGTGGFGSTGT